MGKYTELVEKSLTEAKKRESFKSDGGITMVFFPEFDMYFGTKGNKLFHIEQQTNGGPASHQEDYPDNITPEENEALTKYFKVKKFKDVNITSNARHNGLT